MTCTEHPDKPSTSKTVRHGQWVFLCQSCEKKAKESKELLYGVPR